MEKSEILKRCRAYNHSNDNLYYLIHQKEFDTYAVISAPCNYLFSNDQDQFFGTGVYMSNNNFSSRMRTEFTSQKELLGIPLTKTTTGTIGGESYTLDNYEIRELPYLHRPDTAPRFSSPFYPAYTCFECEDVIDIVEPKAALRELCRRDEGFRSFLTELAETFGTEPDKLGLSGSLSLGADSPGDYDIVFYGNVDKLRRINDLIKEINRLQGIPKVGGLPLPFRFIFKECIIDAIFVYEDSDLLTLHTARTIKTNVPFKCRVTDDTRALQFEPFFGVDNEAFSSLIIAESFFHAVIQKGNTIEGIGDILEWEHNGAKENVMLCKDPYRQIKDWTRYFFQYQ